MVQFYDENNSLEYTGSPLNTDLAKDFEEYVDKVRNLGNEELTEAFELFRTKRLLYTNAEVYYNESIARFNDFEKKLNQIYENMEDGGKKLRYERDSIKYLALCAIENRLSNDKIGESVPDEIMKKAHNETLNAFKSLGGISSDKVNKKDLESSKYIGKRTWIEFIGDISRSTYAFANNLWNKAVVYMNTSPIEKKQDHSKAPPIPSFPPPSVQNNVPDYPPPIPDKAKEEVARASILKTVTTLNAQRSGFSKVVNNQRERAK